MDSKLINQISEYAKLFSQKKFIESGYIAVRYGDGIAITVQKADLNNIGENDVVFVNDKNIESYEGNFRAAAVILFCALRQDKTSEAAAIVDIDDIMNYSSKRKPLQPVMDNVAKLLGVTVKCSSKNVAAEIVTALSGYRNACFMPDAGALVKARSLKELVHAVDVLDKACSAEMLAENKGGTQHINPINAFIEQVVYKLTNKEKSENSGNSEKTENAENASEEVSAKEATENSSMTDNGQSGGEQQSDNGQEEANNNQSHDECENNACQIEYKTINVGGKLVAFACPKYITAVSAIGKPMTVTDEYKEKLGEEIPCIPSKMILTKKAHEKAVELTGDSKVCFMAQHGVIVMADSEQELEETVALVENACKSYLEA
ncbi:MAG: class II aldolase/adducin family protein [Clostridia bacterium]|nr:class II aldolase/adducin family protein [Clostridia bacterium]